MGRRLDDLGTPALSWRDLVVILRMSPESSAYKRAKFGEQAYWGLSEHLLAAAVDALNAANWQRQNAGSKTPSPRPKPVPRPGVEDRSQRLGGGAIPVNQFDDWWESDQSQS